MNAMRRLLTSLLLVASIPAVAEAPLGRLFLTPEKRELLERQRALNVLETQVMSKEPTILVNGQVLRSSGKRTTWINGQAQNDQETRTGVVARPDKNASRVTLESSDDPRATVNVGESLNRGTQETSSPLGDGKIVVHKRDRR